MSSKPLLLNSSRLVLLLFAVGMGVSCASGAQAPAVTQPVRENERSAIEVLVSKTVDALVLGDERAVAELMASDCSSAEDLSPLGWGFASVTAKPGLEVRVQEVGIHPSGEDLASVRLIGQIWVAGNESQLGGDNADLLQVVKENGVWLWKNCGAYAD
jgi:hypothetical protein